MAQLNVVQPQVGVTIPQSVPFPSFNNLAKAISRIDDKTPIPESKLDEVQYEQLLIQEMNDLTRPIAMGGQARSDWYLGIAKQDADGNELGTYATIADDYAKFKEQLGENVPPELAAKYETLALKVWNSYNDTLNTGAAIVSKDMETARYSLGAEEAQRAGNTGVAIALTQHGMDIGVIETQEGLNIIQRYSIEEDQKFLAHTYAQIAPIVAADMKKANDDIEAGNLVYMRDGQTPKTVPYHLDEFYMEYKDHYEQMARKNIENSAYYNNWITDDNGQLVYRNGVPEVDENKVGRGLTFDGWKAEMDKQEALIADDMDDYYNSRAVQSAMATSEIATSVREIQGNVRIDGNSLNKGQANKLLDQLNAGKARGEYLPEDADPLINILMSLKTSGNDISDRSKILADMAIKKELIQLYDKGVDYQTAIDAMGGLTYTDENGETQNVPYDMYKDSVESFDWLDARKAIYHAFTNAMKYADNDEERFAIQNSLNVMMEQDLLGNIDEALMNKYAAGAFFAASFSAKFKHGDRIVFKSTGDGPITKGAQFDNAAMLDGNTYNIFNSSAELKGVYENTYGTMKIFQDGMLLGPDGTSAGTFDFTPILNELNEATALAIQANGGAAQAQMFIEKGSGKRSAVMSLGGMRTIELDGEMVDIEPVLMLDMTAVPGIDGISEDHLSLSLRGNIIPDINRTDVPMHYRYWDEKRQRMSYVAIAQDDFMGGSLSAYDLDREEGETFMGADMYIQTEDGGGNGMFPGGWNRAAEERMLFNQYDWEALDQLQQERIATDQRNRQLVRTGEMTQAEADAASYHSNDYPFTYTQQGFLEANGFVFDDTTFQEQLHEVFGGVDPVNLLVPDPSERAMLEQGGRKILRLTAQYDPETGTFTYPPGDSKGYAVVDNPAWVEPDATNIGEYKSDSYTAGNAYNYAIENGLAPTEATAYMVQNTEKAIDDYLLNNDNPNRRILKAMLSGISSRDSDAYMRLLKKYEAQTGMNINIFK